MIGSLMSRMSTAQNMDVKQLQQAVQDGTLPAYVGIPLIQDKMKQQQMTQAGRPQPQQPPIADQILGAAKQQEDRGIDAAQSNLPEMTAAEGGIMSYADGGDVDPLSYEDQAQDQQDMQELSMTQQGVEDPEMDALIAAKSSQPSYVNKTPNVEQGIKGPSTESLISHILKKESGGKDFDKKGNPLTSSSGAKFAMQVLPSTARDPGFGIKPAKGETPEEYNRVGRELAVALLNKYKNPVHAAAAYNAGSGTIDKWLAQGADPARLPKETQGYIQGIQLAQGGIASYAKGGIAHFATAGEVKAARDVQNQALGAVDQSLSENPPSDYMGSVTDWMQSPQGIEQLKNRQIAIDAIKNNAPIPALNSLYQPYTPKTIAQAQAEKVAATSPPVNMPPAVAPSGINSILSSTGFKGAGNFNIPSITTTDTNTNTIAPEVPTGYTAPQTPAPTAWDQYLANLASSREDLKKQKDEDKYMSLLTAGLGMVKSAGTVKPGEVHSGLSDISTGSMEGISYASNAQKQRAAQEAALNTAENSALFRQEANKNAAEINKAKIAALSEKPSIEDRKYTQYSQMVARHPQILEQNRMMQEEMKNSTLTDDRARQYQANIQKIQQAIAKQLQINPDVAVQLSPITDPTKPVTPGMWDKIKSLVGSSAPAASSVDTNNPLLK